MAFFNTKDRKYIPQPIPPTPPYVPPVPPAPPSAGEGSVPDIPRPTYSDSTTITLYTTTSETNNLNKVLQNALSFDISFKNDVSEFNPVITLESDVMLENYNYAYIALSKRYYYISEIIWLRANIYQINLKTDVLMSFKNGIKNLIGILDRTCMETYANLDLNDGSFINQMGKEIQIIRNPNKVGLLDNGTWVLVTVGKQDKMTE